MRSMFSSLPIVSSPSSLTFVFRKLSVFSLVKCDTRDIVALSQLQPDMSISIMTSASPSGIFVMTAPRRRSSASGSTFLTTTGLASDNETRTQTTLTHILGTFQDIGKLLYLDLVTKHKSV